MNYAVLKGLKLDSCEPEFDWQFRTTRSEDRTPPSDKRAPPSSSIIVGDSREVLKGYADCSVDLIVTDPPYFLDGLDAKWRKGGADSPRATGTIGGLPVGMKFDPRQGRALQKFIHEIALESIRVLKPGAFCLMFSQPRLAHRMAIALEDAQFEIRDLCVWNYNKKSQFKAFKQDHFVDRMKITDSQKAVIKTKLGGRTTPQLRGQHESIILAQKPKQGTFVDNWLAWETGLMNAGASLDGKRPSNVMCVEKPDVSERGAAASHLTPKPVALLAHLLRLFSKEGQLVLDPFMGSGSLGVAADMTARAWSGIEINPEYADLARERIKTAARKS